MSDDATGESDDEWRFSVDEFEDATSGDGDAAIAGSSPANGAAVTTADDEHDDGNVAGEFSPNVPVVPETPNLESAVFVTLGAILSMVAFAALVTGPSFGTFDALTVALVVGALGALAYVVLVRLTPDT